jgi:hypothetical protein
LDKPSTEFHLKSKKGVLPERRSKVCKPCEARIRSLKEWSIEEPKKELMLELAALEDLRAVISVFIRLRDWRDEKGRRESIEPRWF